MAKLTALRVAALVQARHQYGRGELPEPIGITVGRAGHLTLVFDDRDDMIAWRDQLYEYEEIPYSSWNRRQAFRGVLRAYEGDRDHEMIEIPTTVSYRPAP